MQWSLSGGVVWPHAGLYPARSGARYILEWCSVHPGVVLGTSWSGCHECLLDGPVQVLVPQHVFKPMVLQDRGEEFTNTGS